MAGKAVAPEQNMAGGHPRHAPLRASLHTATGEDTEPKDSAQPIKAEDAHRALELLRAFAESASPDEVLATDWDHGSARCWPRSAEAEKEAFALTKEQLLRGAASCATEFRISFQFRLRFMGSSLFKVLIAGGAQLTGWRQGRQIG